MVARGTPLWLARPTRFAAIGRTPARAMLAGLILLALLAAATAMPAPPPSESLHRAIVAGMTHGADFYGSLGDLLRGDPTLAGEWVLPPTLAVVEATLPPWATALLVAALLTTVLWAGTVRLLPLLGRTSGRIGAVILLLVGIAACALAWAAAPHAGVAAALVALALLLQRDDRWIEPAALACAAALIDPGALVAIAAMLVAARTRREAVGWSVAAAVAGAALACHLWALAGAPVGGALSSPDLLDPLLAGVLPGIPVAIAAPALVLAAFGWAALPGDLGVRVFAVLVAGIAVQRLTGLASAPIGTVLWPVGLAFAPDGIADLVRRAYDRRRITVTRITRQEQR